MISNLPNKKPFNDDFIYYVEPKTLNEDVRYPNPKEPHEHKRNERKAY